jgi:predicted alpha/beta hydrolase family esterase
MSYYKPMKSQLVVIHGGMVYPTKDAYLRALKEDPVDIEYFQQRLKWKDRLEEDLGDTFEILRPEMPSPGNAQYTEWCIWFERMIPFLRDGVILIGHSLGGVFLARYLNENDISVKVKATILVAAPFNDESIEPLGEFRITGSLEKFEAQGGQIHLWFSKDDPIVVFDECERYTKAIPSAQVRTFTDRGHFNLESFPEFSALVRSLIL